MGKIGLIVAAAGIVLSGAILLKMKNNSNNEVPKLLFVGVGVVVIGAVLTMLHI